MSNTREIIAQVEATSKRMKEHERKERARPKVRKIVEKLERGGVDPSFIERVRKDFALPQVVATKGSPKKTVAQAHYAQKKRSEHVKVGIRSDPRAVFEFLVSDITILSI
jgi:hypothetical protein